MRALHARRTITTVPPMDLAKHGSGDNKEEGFRAAFQIKWA